MFFIYVLRCPVQDAVRYIGMSKNPLKRLRGHIARAPNGKHYCARWIAQLLNQGARPTLEIVCRLPVGADWQAIEKMLIASGKYFSLPLTNIAVGGEGVIFTDPEARLRQVEGRRITMANSEVQAAWIGNLKSANASPEVRALRSKSAKAMWSDPEKRSAIVGAMNEPAALAVRAKATKANWSCPEFAATATASLKAAMQKPGAVRKLVEAGQTPQAKAKRAASLKAAAATPETKARMSAASLDVWSRPEARAAHAEGAKASWENQGIRDNRVKSINAPEVKAAMSEARKAYWSDPEKAEKLKAAQKAAWMDPEAKQKRLASRVAMWSDPVRRAELIVKQKAAWAKRKLAA